MLHHTIASIVQSAWMQDCNVFDQYLHTEHEFVANPMCVYASNHITVTRTTTLEQQDIDMNRLIKQLLQYIQRKQDQQQQQQQVQFDTIEQFALDPSIAPDQTPVLHVLYDKSASPSHMPDLYCDSIQAIQQLQQGLDESHMWRQMFYKAQIAYKETLVDCHTRVERVRKCMQATEQAEHHHIGFSLVDLLTACDQPQNDEEWPKPELWPWPFPGDVGDDDDVDQPSNDNHQQQQDHNNDDDALVDEWLSGSSY